MHLPRLASLVASTFVAFTAGAARAQAPAAAPAPSEVAPEAATPSAPSGAPASPPPAPAVRALDTESPSRAPMPASVASGGSSSVLFLPALGIHSFQNDSAKGFDAGLRVGSLIGVRVNDNFSLDGELALDLLNPNNVPSGVDVTALQFQAALSPLFHAKSGGTEFVIGPKLGLFWMSEDASSGGQSVSSSVHGWLYGFNAGLFGAINDKVSMGGLVSFDVENATEACLTVPGSAEMCSSDDLDSSAKVLGVSLALLM